jgi:cytosine/adenosine deaminase-related metal-dependent hydrolase
VVSSCSQLFHTVIIIILQPLPTKRNLEVRSIPFSPLFFAGFSLTTLPLHPFVNKPLHLNESYILSKSIHAIRGTFFDFIDDPWKHVGREQESARFYSDGMLVIEDGIIKAFGPFKEIQPRYSGIEITHLPDRLIVPGFIDGHIHFPQTRMLGAFGLQLLGWLQTWVFPEEMKYKDRAYAREGARNFFDALLASGTTTCQAFTSTWPVVTEEFFEEAGRRNMRVISGLTGIDRCAPKEGVTLFDASCWQSVDCE